MKRAAVLLLFLAVGLLVRWLDHRIVHVITPSIPPGWYFVDRRTPPRVGDYVVACLPPEVERLGLARAYLIPGECAGGAAPSVKRLVGVGGDLIDVERDGVRVNGRLVTGPLAARDTRGRPLTMAFLGPHHLAPDQRWLLGDHPRSWDSRYFGPITARAIIGRALPLYTTPIPSPTKGDSP